jgi:hypothetical protein
LLAVLQPYANKDMIELFDRIIGQDIYKVSDELLLPTLKLFAESGTARGKIFMTIY